MQGTGATLVAWAEAKVTKVKGGLLEESYRDTRATKASKGAPT